MLNKLFKSVLENDKAPVVICDLEHTILYMNPSAKECYRKELTGSNLKNCHSAKSIEIIDKVVSWFEESKDNNIIFTYHSDKENKDVYMVALRDDDSSLIGYYEKHEYRDRETKSLYKFR